MKEKKMIDVDSEVGNNCVEENFNGHFSEILIAFHHCRAIANSVLMFILQLTSTSKRPLLSAILNDPVPALGWLHVMTDFTQSRFSNGKDLKSVRILLETEWPQMISRVEVSWLRHVTKWVIVVDSDKREGMGTRRQWEI